MVPLLYTSHLTAVLALSYPPKSTLCNKGRYVVVCSSELISIIMCSHSNTDVIF